MTNPQPLSAHQRNSIRATARAEWMKSRSATTAISAAQLIICVSSFIHLDQERAAHKLVADLITHWSENAIANPDVSPMWGEPGQQGSPVQVLKSDLKPGQASGGAA